MLVVSKMLGNKKFYFEIFNGGEGVSLTKDVNKAFDFSKIEDGKEKAEEDARYIDGTVEEIKQ